jgi:PqqD family protein of HPr-rel-A system
MNPIPAHPLFLPNPNVILREVDQALIVFDPTTDAVHTLNPTAAFVWDRLDTPPETIARALQNTYDVSSEVAEKDVDLILQHLHTLGLIRTSPVQ